MKRTLPHKKMVGSLSYHVHLNQKDEIQWSKLNQKKDALFFILT
jgi:hypothetical protein